MSAPVSGFLSGVHAALREWRRRRNVRLEQQHLVARVCRQPVRDGRTGRTGAYNNVIVGLHVLWPALSLRRLLLRHYAKGR